MAASNDKERPIDPKEMLPEDSVLSFEEYMEMQRSIGEENRYRILYFLHHQWREKSEGIARRARSCWEHPAPSPQQISRCRVGPEEGQKRGRQ
ncbi:MAG: hypothetical protein U5K37_07895 [Natrialbaceae archaeon]|nr:hypothetical protein [Natrialbaceae archaeon]